MQTEILAVVQPSAVRRWMGVVMLAGLGGLVVYVALASPPAVQWQVFLIATGLLALWMAERMRRATGHRIELTETELRSSEGVLIAAIDDIVSLDRGFFAFKPSNGFLIKTRSRSTGIWRPGLWWRMGRRIGVGGVTPGSQTKAMSEILAAMLAQRDQDSYNT